MMIGFFPDPYPDELLFSVCARYHQRIKYHSKSITSRDLVGSERANIAVDLPGRLNQLTSVIFPGHHYSVERLINENTLLPFYSPFLPPKRVVQLREAMAGNNQVSAIHSRSGILTSKIRLEYFRFCPKCVYEDRQRYGETYWHRSHQVPGGIVCSTHRVWLEQSDQRLSQLGGLQSFLAANQVVPIVQGRLLDLKLPDHQTHWYIAHSVEWLLNNYSEGNDPDELRGRYRGLLVDHNLVTSTGAIRMQLLQEQFLKFYSKDLLNNLSCELDRRFNWLKRILQKARVTQHPIHHLLLMKFLGVSIEEFFSLPVSPQPFGAGPWPCLNPVCKHFKQSVIAECQLRTTHKINDGLFGIFQCECGYSYRCRKPKLKNSKGGATDIESFGPIWEAKLSELYRKDNYTVREMAERLGVSAFMIRRKARELGIVKPLSKDRNRSQHKTAMGRPKILSPEELLSRQTNYRKQWKKLVKENPTASRTELRRMQSSIYNWLAKHDYEWLDNTSPLRRHSQGPPVKNDWKKRDIDYAAAAQTYSEELRRILGRPIWGSKTRIAKTIGALAIVTKRTHLIPITVKMLERVSETKEDFAIRRIQWAAESIQNDDMRVTLSQLIVRAALSRNMQLKPVIQKKLLEVIEESNTKIVQA